MSKINASQAAVKLARTNKLDLGEVKPSNEKTGQITKGDVENFIKAQNAAADAKAAAAAGDGDQGAPATDAGDGTDEPAAAEPTDAGEPKAEEKKASSGRKGKVEKREIEKFRDDLASVWWCPFCDHSQPGEHRECGGCGAVRGGHLVAAVGDEVTAA